MKKTSSDVWQFFDRIAEDDRCVAVICRLCRKEMKYFSNTTNLRLHLTNKHAKQWESRDTLWQKVKTKVTITTHQDSGNVQGMEAIDTAVMSGEEWLEDEFSSVEPFSSNDSSVEQFSPNDFSVEQFSSNDSSVEQCSPSDSSVESIFEPECKKRYTRLAPKNINSELRSPRPVFEPNHSTSDDMPNNSGCYIVEQSHRDEFSVFGDYIASKLRNLKIPRTQGNVQQVISTILWQAEFGMFDDVDSVRKVMMNSDLVCQTNTNPSLLNTTNQASPRIIIMGPNSQ